MIGRGQEGRRDHLDGLEFGHFRRWGFSPYASAMRQLADMDGIRKARDHSSD